MRNYRAGLAKWQTADPMGYPDGWNQLAYCGNGVTGAVDLWGCVIYYTKSVIESANIALGNAMRVAKEQDWEIGDNHYFSTLVYVQTREEVLEPRKEWIAGHLYEIREKKYYGDAYQEYYSVCSYLKSSYLDGGITGINIATSLGAIVLTGGTSIVLSVVALTTTPKDILNSIIGNKVVLRIGDGYKLISSDVYIETVEVSRTRLE